MKYIKNLSIICIISFMLALFVVPCFSFGVATRILMVMPQTKFIVATGGSITTDGDYKIHTFTSSGTFTVTKIGYDLTYGDKVEYLIVAGGGGGSGSANVSATQITGSAGGAGGLVANEAYDQTVTAQEYTIIVGEGGPGHGYSLSGEDGGDSSTFGHTADGGGGGGSYNGNGRNGGCGGGSTGYTSPGSGTQGGDGDNSLNTDYGGPGGGMNENGGTDGTYDGGDGVSNDITGASITYGGGGSGGVGVAGGEGGGGASGNESGGGDGTDGLGGGGGAGFDSSSSGVLGGDGGNGVVIIRYKFQ